MCTRLIRRAVSLGLALMLCMSCARAQSAMNILLIGVDAAGGEARGRSDTMILVRADPARREVRMVSFLRDLYVQVEGAGDTRLNAAYTRGGAELLKSTLRDHFGTEIHRTVTVDFALLQQLVDDLGGIELDITEAERRHLNALLEDHGADCPVAESGLQLLNGMQTLCFSRIRKLDSDFQRTSRQQAVIAAMIRKASGQDIWDMLRLALRYLPQVETDMNLSDVAGLLPLIAHAGELQFHAAQVPFEGAYRDETVNGMMVLVPELAANREKLQRFWEGND